MHRSKTSAANEEQGAASGSLGLPDGAPGGSEGAPSSVDPEFPSLSVSYREVLQTMPIFVVVIDREARIQYVNRTFPFNSPEAICGTLVYDYLQGEYREQALRVIERVFAEGQPESAEMAGPGEGADQAWYLYQIAPCLRDGQVVAAIITAFDITQHKRTDLALSQSEAKWRSLVATAPALILIYDLDFKIQYINYTVEGFSVEEVLGTNGYDYIDPDFRPLVQGCVESVLRTGQYTSCELRGDGPRGTQAWYHSRLGPLTDGDRTTGIILIAIDITEQKEAEEKLRAEQELLRQLLELNERERQELTEDIHDNVVQNLVGAHMQVQAIQRLAAEGKPVNRRQCQAVLDLLNEMIGYGRRKISKLRPLIIDELGLLAAIQYLMAEKRDQCALHISCHVQGNLDGLSPLLQSNLFRILLDSLANVEYHSQAKETEIVLRRSDSVVELEVHDEGVGFDPQRIPGGRFGLRGMRERARLLGGSMRIESAPGQGTHLFVRLPVVGGRPVDALPT